MKAINKNTAFMGGLISSDGSVALNVHCQFQCFPPPGKRAWNDMYTQAYRHQQVILIQCMRVISQVCLQAHSTLYSAKNIRESIWEFYFWIHGICPVLKRCTGSKHKVFLLKLTWLPTQAWSCGEKSLALFLFPLSYPFSHKNYYFVVFSLSV